MGSRRIRAAPSALALALTGCGLTLALAGCGGSAHTPSLSQLPLVSGASVVAQAKQCDQGANAFCAIQAVVVDRRFHSSGGFVSAENRWLHKLGWSSAAGDDGVEAAADSPGHKVRLTYATGGNDLLGWIQHWIKRPRSIALALDHEFINGVPTMSVMLEEGPT
jgi:hypothetical protein